MLLDLPNELLLDISKNFGPKALNALIQASLRLAKLLTPLLNLFALKPKYRVTALYCAIIHGNEELVRLILEKGRNFVILDIFYQHVGNVLYDASSRRFDEALIRVLLQKRATIVVQDSLDKSTPLHWATRHGHETMFRLLLKAAVSLEIKDIRGWTALHQAVIEENGTMAELLLLEGADINAIDTNWETPLHLAAKSGSEAMVGLLLEWEDLDLTSHKSALNTPFDVAERGGHKDVAALLLERMDTGFKDGRNETVLHMAARYNYITAARIHLENGASVAVLNDRGISPLQLAVEFSGPEMVELFLDNGGNPNATEEDNYTALHLAVSCWKKDVVELLLKRGADTSLKTCSGETAVQLIGMGIGKKKKKNELLEEDEDEDEDEDEGVGFVDPYMVEHRKRMARLQREGEEIFQLLLDYGAEIEVSDDEQ